MSYTRRAVDEHSNNCDRQCQHFTALVSVLHKLPAAIPPLSDPAAVPDFQGAKLLIDLLPVSALGSQTIAPSPLDKVPAFHLSLLVFFSNLLYNSLEPFQEGTIKQCLEESMSQKHPTFTITMRDVGKMTGELYPEFAPEAVGNFIALANSGFYNGLTFHRVIPGFMIQGGCPEGIGIGGPGYCIKGEFAQNAHSNPLKHTKGVLSMARSQRNDSAGSQFFIMTSDSPHLDGAYAGFGKVTQGLEVAEGIVSTKRDGRDKPLTPQVIESITVDTQGQEYPFRKL